MRPGLSWYGKILPLVAAAVVAAVAGASRGTASDTNYCNQPDPTGRQFCIRVVDSDGVSPTGTFGAGQLQATVTAYQFYDFIVENVGGSALTRGAMTVKLTDNVPGSDPVPSTAEFVKSTAAFCTPTASNAVSCTLPNLAADGSVSFRLAFRTSNTPGVTSTDANVTAVFKENTTNGANPSTLTFAENTSLEPDPEASVSYSPTDRDTQIATDPTYDLQFSSLAYRVPAGHAGFVSHLSESSNVVCAAGLSCFGEGVHTDLSDADAGTFTASNLFHLRITMSLDLVPTGNTRAIVVSHQLESGEFEIISARCSSQPPAGTDQLPCIVVQKNNQSKLLIVDIWAYKNGSWMVGG